MPKFVQVNFVTIKIVSHAEVSVEAAVKYSDEVHCVEVTVPAPSSDCVRVDVA